MKLKKPLKKASALDRAAARKPIKASSFSVHRRMEQGMLPGMVEVRDYVALHPEAVGELSSTAGYLVEPAEHHPVMTTEKPDPEKFREVYVVGGEDQPFKVELREGIELTPEQAKLLQEYEDLMNRDRIKRLERTQTGSRSPEDAHNAGLGYTGPAMADKGLKDGSCNRTACQLPMPKFGQWIMDGAYAPGGALYYCDLCARKFLDADRQFGDPPRVRRCEA